MSGPRRVAVVTGGGRGIGAAIAEELGRAGTFVVTVDPLVTLDGSATAEASAEPSTAERIVAAGGAARASSVSVTDADGVEQLFADLVEEFGRVDAVVNVAGISRPTSFARGDEADWRAVVEVHLDGYRNILRAALPRMAAAGHGRVVGVTSGSGWRAADAGAYAAAKRAVAALTWQLGRHTPPGVTVNALSPIALTRMVTAALGRAAGPSAASGGLALAASMPAPEEIGPLGAHLAADGLAWCSGQVVFGGGSELAVLEPPRLLEVVRADAETARAMVAAAIPGALVPAEAAQLSQGGANPRFGAPSLADPAPGAEAVCGLLVADPELAAALASALTARRVRVVTLEPEGVPPGFAGAAAAMTTLAGRAGTLDAVVVGLPALASTPVGASTGWERVLGEHDGVTEGVLTDAAWARAAADHAAATERPLRLVTLTDAATSGGRSRAQAFAQLARSARGATGDRVTAFSVAVTSDATPEVAAELAAHLACEPEAAALSGAELDVGPGWFGLSRHPRPGTSIVLGGTALPGWLDDTLRAAVLGNT